MPKAVKESSISAYKGGNTTSTTTQRYTLTQETTSFKYTAGLTVPNSIIEIPANPMRDHNRDLDIAFHPRRHGCKAAPIKREHNTH